MNNLLIHKDRSGVSMYFYDVTPSRQICRTEEFRQYLNTEYDPDDYNAIVVNLEQYNYLSGVFVDDSEFQECVNSARQMTKASSCTETSVK